MPRKGICLLVAFVMLLSPAGFEQLANASVSYSQLGTSTWGAGDRIIEYGEWNGTGRTGTFTLGYDANGSVTKKIAWNTQGTSDPADDTKIETVTSTYNLQNRLARVETTDHIAVTTVVAYKYNDDGIRVKKEHFDGTDTTVTSYLIDSYNHTGYSQVLEETADDGSTVTTKTYTIGDDVITQATPSNIEHLLYDGHGSTRQTVDNTGSITDCFSYDAYGVTLGNPASTTTNLLYAGEQFDTDSQQYYLRARYYNPLNGTFNRIDSFSGNLHDPQSLHKYLYCHANPVNNIDPTGNMTLITKLVVFAIIAILAAMIIPPLVRGLRRAFITGHAERLLNEVEITMGSSGWHDPGRSTSYDNALLHTVASMIAVGSGLFESPQAALNAFQAREQGQALHTQMDRANNVLGNWIAQQRGDKMYILRNVRLTWIEEVGGNRILVRKKYPKTRDIEKLRDILFKYNMADLNP